MCTGSSGSGKTAAPQDYLQFRGELCPLKIPMSESFPIISECDYLEMVPAEADEVIVG